MSEAVVGQARIEPIHSDGFAARHLVSPGGVLEATAVVGAGMVVSSLRHEGAELLDRRAGVARYARAGSTMGIPLLHPWANRLQGLAYAAAGRTVRLDPSLGVLHLDERGLPIHGLLLARSHFAIAEEAATASHARLVTHVEFPGDPALEAAFPFPHRLVLGLTLDDGALLVEIGVVPSADVPVPIAFGFHPYLTLPGCARAAWHVEMPVRERLVLDAHLLPTGDREPVTISPGPLGDRSYDDAFVAPARFVLAGGGRRVEVAFLRGYPFAQVFSPPGASFICFEPMTAPGNALARGGPELRLALPGTRFDADFAVRVTRG